MTERATTVSALRIALAQTAPILREPAHALTRIDSLAGRAAAAGADLLIVPEMYLTGYAVGAADVSVLAQPANGPAAHRVGVAARKHDLAIVYGFPERAADGRVFNSASLVAEDGSVAATYRKLHLFGDVDRSQFAAGDDRPPVVQWRDWRIALGICYDVEFPEFVRMAALDGAELVCVPTANMVGYERVSRLLVPARACENQVFVAYANFTGSDEAFDYCGTSVVADPTGRVLAEGSGEREDLVIADVSREALEAARNDYDCLADRRPDVYGDLGSRSNRA